MAYFDDVKTSETGFSFDFGEISGGFQDCAGGFVHSDLANGAQARRRRQCFNHVEDWKMTDRSAAGKRVHGEFGPGLPSELPDPEMIR